MAYTFFTTFISRYYDHWHENMCDNKFRFISVFYKTVFFFFSYLFSFGSSLSYFWPRIFSFSVIIKNIWVPKATPLEIPAHISHYCWGRFFFFFHMIHWILELEITILDINFPQIISNIFYAPDYFQDDKIFIFVLVASFCILFSLYFVLNWPFCLWWDFIQILFEDQLV